MDFPLHWRGFRGDAFTLQRDPCLNANEGIISSLHFRIAFTLYNFNSVGRLPGFNETILTPRICIRLPTGRTQSLCGHVHNESLYGTRCCEELLLDWGKNIVVLKSKESFLIIFSCFFSCRGFYFFLMTFGYYTSGTVSCFAFFRNVGGNLNAKCCALTSVRRNYANFVGVSCESASVSKDTSYSKFLRRQLCWIWINFKVLRCVSE